MQSTDMNYDDDRKPIRNIVISVVAILLVGCCCVLLAVGGYYGYKAYVAGKEAVDQIKNLIPPTVAPFNSGDPNATPPAIPNFDVGAIEVPEGGLADDETKYVAWVSIQLVSLMADCGTPTASGTTIRVVQEPADDNSPWVEEWTADCGDGASQSFNITFTPENGTVNVSVETPSSP